MMNAVAVVVFVVFVVPHRPARLDHKPETSGRCAVLAFTKAASQKLLESRLTYLSFRLRLWQDRKLAGRARSVII